MIFRKASRRVNGANLVDSQNAMTADGLNLAYSRNAQPAPF